MEKITKEAFVTMKVADANKLVSTINAQEKIIAKQAAKIEVLEAKIAAMKTAALAAKEAAKAKKASK